MSIQGSYREGPAEDRFSELSAILLGPERDLLRELRHRLEDPDIRAKDVAVVLAEAVRICATGDPKLRNALQPAIEESIAISVRKNPRMLADALFPIFGKAIRRAITSELEGMMQSLSQVLEQSFSFRSLRWRWQAFRTRKPYAEIVLLNSLLYRVEQVFLIHRGTGLLLQHAESGSPASRDPEMVSGMLTAVQDFVRDSIGGAEGEDLQTVRVGEFSVVLAYAPGLILAGFVRGVVPHQLHRLFQDAVQAIQEEQLSALASFRGDTSKFDSSRPHLVRCLVGQGDPGARVRSGSLTAKLLVAALPLVLILALGSWWWVAARAEKRWGEAVELLGAQPGIVITASGKRAGQYFISGLRDPLAADPAPLLEQAGLARSGIAFQWEPYQSEWPRFVAERQYIAAKEQVEKRMVRFELGRATIDLGQQYFLHATALDIASLMEVAAASGREVKVEVLGNTDLLGTEEINAVLARDRAANVQATLESFGVHPDRLLAQGRPGACDAEEEKALAECRSTTFRVLEGGR